MLDLASWREWRRWVPAECPGCDRRVSGQGLCPGCCARLPLAMDVRRCPVCAHPWRPGGCPDCRQLSPAFDGVVAAFDYADLGERLIKAYKFSGQLALARLLADRLLAALRTASGDAGAADCVVPVPARHDSLMRRGYSPPAEVARLVARGLRLPYRLDLLHRVHDGPKQGGLGRAARLRAPTGVYACGPVRGRPPDLSGLRVAVVDDVLTTGATLHAVARVLRAAGAARVNGWVLARAASDPDEAPRALQ